MYYRKVQISLALSPGLAGVKGGAASLATQPQGLRDTWGAGGCPGVKPPVSRDPLLCT